MNQTCVDGECVGECVAGEKGCDEKTPKTCSAMGLWEPGEACAYACFEGECDCEPGQARCVDEKTLEVCGEDRTWKASPCVEQTCVADSMTIFAACTGECAPGKRCKGDTPQMCSPMGKWEGDTPCPPGEVCSDGSCNCATGDLRCHENTPQICNFLHEWQDDGEPCENTNRTCDPDEAACVGDCVNGAHQCDGDTVQTCNAKGKWEPAMTCGVLGCVDGQCAVCNQGETRCTENSPQTCAEDGQWESELACEKQTCLGGTCVGQCAMGTNQCVGKYPQFCDSGGVWRTIGQSCAIDESCYQGACIATCQPGARRCSGDVPQICDEQGAWKAAGAACGPCIECDPETGMCEPAAVPEADCTEPEEIDEGDSHTCARLPSGRVKCWGKNDRGQLGLGDTYHRGDQPGEMGSSLLAVELGVDVKAAKISAGGTHTCALLSDGRIKCWGGNASGQLGLGDTYHRGDGVLVPPAMDEMGDALPGVDLGTAPDGNPLTATEISAGGFHTCALLSDGRVKCWGHNSNGQLGLGHTKGRGDDPGEMGEDLAAVNLGVGATASAISAGGNHICALLSDGRVKCWGDNSNGQLGLGDADSHGDSVDEMGDNLPAVNLGLGVVASAISAGGNHTCALLFSGGVKCWGANGNGQLGLGDVNPRGYLPSEMGDALPIVDLGLGAVAIAISAGGFHTCALLSNGRVKCWGRGWDGALGLGDTTPHGDNVDEMGDNLPAVNLGLGAKAKAIRVSSYYGFSCALLSGGSVKCWGTNSYGQLGLFDTVGRGTSPNEMGDSLPPVDL